MWERSKKIENMDGKVIIFPLNFKAMPGTLDWGRVKIKGNKAIVSPKTRTRTNSTIWIRPSEKGSKCTWSYRVVLL